MSTTTDTITSAADQIDQQQDEAAPTPTPKSLAEILAARIRKLDRERREAEELAQRKLEGQRQDQLTAFTVRYEQTFPQALRDALNATTSYDTTSEGYDGERAERGPFATFEHRVPGSAGPDGDLWVIRRAYSYGTTHWSLEGPNEYHADLGYDDDYSSPTGPLLDALNAYPDWLATKEQREREKAERAAAKSQEAENARQQRDEQPIYAYITEDDLSHHGILHTGSRVWLDLATPDTADERLAYERIDRLSASIVEWDAHWLLINLDDDETQQRLIPIGRVVSVQVRV